MCFNFLPGHRHETRHGIVSRSQTLTHETRHGSSPHASCMHEIDLREIFECAHLKFTVYGRKQASTYVYMLTHFRNAVPLVWGSLRLAPNTDTVGTTSNCPYYRGVPTLEVSGIFPVGVAMHTRLVEHFEGTFHSSPSPYDGKKG